MNELEMLDWAIANFETPKGEKILKKLNLPNDVLEAYIQGAEGSQDLVRNTLADNRPVDIKSSPLSAKERAALAATNGSDEDKQAFLEGRGYKVKRDGKNFYVRGADSARWGVIDPHGFEMGDIAELAPAAISTAAGIAGGVLGAAGGPVGMAVTSALATGTANAAIQGFATEMGAQQKFSYEDMAVDAAVSGILGGAAPAVVSKAVGTAIKVSPTVAAVKGLFNLLPASMKNTTLDAAIKTATQAKAVAKQVMEVAPQATKTIAQEADLMGRPTAAVKAAQAETKSVLDRAKNMAAMNKIASEEVKATSIKASGIAAETKLKMAEAKAALSNDVLDSALQKVINSGDMTKAQAKAVAQRLRSVEAKEELMDSILTTQAKNVETNALNAQTRATVAERRAALVNDVAKALRKDVGTTLAKTREAMKPKKEFIDPFTTRKRVQPGAAEAPATSSDIIAAVNKAITKPKPMTDLFSRKSPLKPKPKNKP